MNIVLQVKHIPEHPWSMVKEDKYYYLVRGFAQVEEKVFVMARHSDDDPATPDNYQSYHIVNQEHNSFLNWINSVFDKIEHGNILNKEDLRGLKYWGLTFEKYDTVGISSEKFPPEETTP